MQAPAGQKFCATLRHCLCYTAPMRKALPFIFLLSLSLPVSAQIFRLPNPDPQPGDQFGIATSISQDRVVVGASGSNICGESSGVAYVYARDPAAGKWTLESTLQPSDCNEGLFFGKILAMHGDIIAVASYKPAFSNVLPNAVYVFERDSVDWHQTAKLMSPDNNTGPFASAIAVWGNQIVVASAGDIPEGRYHGATYIFEKSGADWSLGQTLTTSAHVVNGIFGSSIALDESTLAVARFGSVSGQGLRWGPRVAYPGA